ncbi:MAG TPA: serine/threonine-protein kinase [Kofleriaceae bacterium]|nr:serine/threonine-protein kinase [Kofleriaceae bacterium]
MDLTGLVAVLGAFGIGPAIVYLRNRHKIEERKLELEAKNGGRDGPETKRLAEENKLLRERVENLETIVCSVDFELNQKLARVIDEQRSLALPAGDPATAATAPAPGADPSPSPSSSPSASPRQPTGALPALDKTATAFGRVQPPSTTSLEPGQVLAQRYRVQRLLGKGGMGAVYLADDEVLGEPVALKVISSAFCADEAAMITRFRREAAAARKVSSPSVIRIHDLGEARPGLVYLSMEYFAGRTLAEVIAQRGVVPLKDVQDILLQIGAGLEAAHQAGVVHRDLKPSNVLVGERGKIKIIDFGLATTAFGDGLTATGAILGTPHYMAPEQVRGKSVDARTDIYALGALAYHLVCGRPPFAGDNPIAIGFAHLSEPVVPPRQLRRDVQPALEAAILAALEKAPEARPASARAFLDQAFPS